MGDAGDAQIPPDGGGGDAGPDAGFDAGFDAGDGGGGGPLLDYGLATFTRASPATHFDRMTGTLTRYAPNEPRILADGSIYLEGERTNLFGNSEHLDGWTTNYSTVTGDVITAPDGSLTAERWDAQDDARAGLFVTSATYGGSTGPTATLSLFAKAVTGSETFRQYWRSPASTNQYSSDHSVGAMWERFAETGADMSRHGVWQATAPSVRTLAVWGAQAELGAFASQYMETGSGRATRVADLLVFPAAPEDMRTSIWTVDVEPEGSSIAMVAEGTDVTLFEFGSPTDGVIFRVGGGILRLSVAVGGATVVESMPLTFGANDTLTVTVDPAAGQLTVSGAVSGDGVSSAGSSWTFPVGSLRVGSKSDGSQSYFGRIGRPR